MKDDDDGQWNPIVKFVRHLQSVAYVYMINVSLTKINLENVWYNWDQKCEGSKKIILTPPSLLLHLSNSAPIVFQ